MFAPLASDSLAGVDILCAVALTLSTQSFCQCVLCPQSPSHHLTFVSLWVPPPLPSPPLRSVHQLCALHTPRDHCQPRQWCLRQWLPNILSLWHRPVLLSRHQPWRQAQQVEDGGATPRVNVASRDDTHALTGVTPFWPPPQLPRHPPWPPSRPSFRAGAPFDGAAVL